jgi:hypothetical protein
MKNQTIPSPSGLQQLSKSVYFIDNDNELIRPVYQRDSDTSESSYRLYPEGGNTKVSDQKVHDYRELAKQLLLGCSVRCRLPSGKSSNRSINSRDIVKLIIEIEK